MSCTCVFAAVHVASVFGALQLTTRKSVGNMEKGNSTLKLMNSRSV